jgi:single-stranded DNA-binding protein
VPTLPQLREINEVFVSGRTTGTPIVQFTRKKGEPLVTVVVVTQLDHNPEFHKIIAFGELVEQVSKLKKGSFVELCGRLQTRHWTDARTGLAREKTEILVLRLRVLSEPPEPLTPYLYHQGDAQ